MSENVPDNVLLAMYTVCDKAVTAGVQPPSLPAEILYSLVSELIERRAAANGAVKRILAAEGSRVGDSMMNRPTDESLAEFAKIYREIATASGPSHLCEVPAIGLVNLADELIEYRKMPRA